MVDSHILQSDDPAPDRELVRMLARACSSYMQLNPPTCDGAELVFYQLVAGAFDLGRAAGMRRLMQTLAGQPYVAVAERITLSIPAGSHIALGREGMN